MSRRSPKPASLASNNESVSLQWLLKGIVLVLVAAAVCTYLSFCLLFYIGQWRMVLSPVLAAGQHPATPNAVRFGTDESGVPQLVGVWIPAPADSQYATTTILFLPGGNSSLSDSAPTIESLHHLGVNILAFDYRGFGFSSGALHPNQKRMTADAESAWRYLTGARAISGGEIIPYGVGVGASLATELAISHPEIPAIILDSPNGDLIDVVLRDPRTKILPVKLLFHERFPLQAPLSVLSIPKLLIFNPKQPSQAFTTAPAPKISVVLDKIPGPQYTEAVTRFLDQYISRSPVNLMSIPTPAGRK
jgi:pimeloyl-ACP methyl ester carboxylesterase